MIQDFSHSNWKGCHLQQCGNDFRLEGECFVQSVSSIRAKAFLQWHMDYLHWSGFCIDKASLWHWVIYEIIGCCDFRVPWTQHGVVLAPLEVELCSWW